MNFSAIAHRWLPPVRAAAAGLALAAACGASAGAASATVTIGSAAQPAGATNIYCAGPGYVYIQPPTDPTTLWSVPAGGGALTAWQTNVSYTFTKTVTLLVLAPGSTSNTFQVVGVDTEQDPSTTPQNGIATFPIATPIEVQPGDLLGLYAEGATVGNNSQGCEWHLSTSPDDVLSTSAAIPVPTVGGSLQTQDVTTAGYSVNVAATLDDDEDAGVTVTAGPANATSGSLADYAATVTNNGPAVVPMTFTEDVPTGVAIDSAVAGDGTCAVAGQLVTCTLTVPDGQSQPVVVLVTPSIAGNFAAAASVALTGNFTDPVAANNIEGATLDVASAPSGVSGGAGSGGAGSGGAGAGGVTGATGPLGSGAKGSAKCQVPTLRKVPVAVAREVLALLNCKVGKTKTATSRRIAKGLVIGTNPTGGWSAPAGATVTLTVSSGRPRGRSRR